MGSYTVRIKALQTAAIVAGVLCVGGHATVASEHERLHPARELHISSSTRALVISPHPDDGVLGAGGLIQRVVARHGSVEVVEVTSGDAFSKGLAAVRRTSSLTPDGYRWYATVREREALHAMKQLGIARSRVRLLGFPDDGLCQLAAADAGANVFESPYTHRDSPPSPELILHDAKYRGVDVRRELEQVLVAFRPNLVVVPDGHDEHPDHCATHALTHAAIQAAVTDGLRPPTVLHYLVHYRNWPSDPAQFPSNDGVRLLKLSPSERAGKRAALEQYRTQLAVMPQFIAAFENADERFVAGDAGPTACWCGGRNIAAPPADVSPQSTSKK